MLENGTLLHYNRNGCYWPTPWNVGCTPRIHHKGELLDEPLKRLMQELGNAINDSLSESDRIAEAIGEIKRAGYDVFLVLEATIGFNRRDEDEEGEEAEFADDAAEEHHEPRRNFETTGKIKFTSQDHRFLRALKIAVDEDNR
jgi:hypothetical protein